MGMKLSNLKGEYDAIFSLGDLCLASIQLRKLGLRPYAGVIDWMGSPSLSDVNRLLRNRFAGFMELQNLSIIGYATEQFICVIDNAYNIVSNHDFSTDKNTLTYLTTYPEVKEKFERRIRRFLEKMETCKRVLFVRTEGTYEEAAELQEVLSSLVKRDFRVLLINHTDVEGIVEDNWSLKKVCAVQFPNKDKWYSNDDYWNAVFDGIRLKS
jgi:hypothetical protein